MSLWTSTNKSGDFCLEKLLFVCFCSPQTGRAGYRSPWGGEIGGAGVDMFGHPGTSSIMPRIDHKDGCSSPDSMASLEYHIG